MHEDDGDGRAQLVRGIGGEARLLRECGVESRERGVQHASETAQFIGEAIGLDALREITGRDLLRRGADVFHRTQRARSEPATTEQTERDDRGAGPRKIPRGTMQRRELRADVATDEEAAVCLREAHELARRSSRAGDMRFITARVRGNHESFRRIRRARLHTTVRMPHDEVSSRRSNLLRQRAAFARRWTTRRSAARIALRHRRKRHTEQRGLCLQFIIDLSQSIRRHEPIRGEAEAHHQRHEQRAVPRLKPPAYRREDHGMQ